MPPTEPQDESDRRAYFRVRTRLPVRSRTLKEDEVEALREEILRPMPLDLGSVEPALALWLERIERKVDRLLVRSGERETPIGDLERQEVTLSGSGMRFQLAERMEAGQDVLIEFELPGPPLRPVRAIGRVVRSEAVEGRCIAHSMAFIVLNDNDRDAILRHVVAVQRRLLRERSQQTEPS